MPRSPSLPGHNAQRCAAYLDALRDAGLDSRPVAVLDAEALEANVAQLGARAGGVPLRLASKSIRIRGVLERVLAAPSFSGTPVVAGKPVFAGSRSSRESWPLRSRRHSGWPPTATGTW